MTTPLTQKQWDELFANHEKECTDSSQGPLDPLTPHATQLGRLKDIFHAVVPLWDKLTYTYNSRAKLFEVRIDDGSIEKTGTKITYLNTCYVSEEQLQAELADWNKEHQRLYTQPKKKRLICYGHGVLAPA